MSSIALAWHIVWFTRVTCSLALLLAVIRNRIHKQFPLFAIYVGWISVAGAILVAMDYAPFVSGNQYFVGVSISNGVAALLAFAVIYQIFVQRLHDYPRIKDLGPSAFRTVTLLCLVTAVALA